MHQIIRKLPTYLYVVYVRTMSLAQTTYCKMIQLVKNACVSSDGVVERYYPAIYLQRLIKTVKSLSQDSQECYALTKLKS